MTSTSPKSGKQATRIARNAESILSSFNGDRDAAIAYAEKFAPQTAFVLRTGI